jgi:hypothetical protein
MAVRTNRDLYAQLTALGIKRDLETYLRALLAAARRFGSHFDPREPTPDEIVALLAAAGSGEPAEFEEAWRSRPRMWDEEPRPVGRARVESVLIGQIVDLDRMRASGQLADDNRYFGLDAPGGGRWYNFDPSSFLECGVAGSVGGTDDDDEVLLVTPPEPVADDDEGRVSLGWSGLCDLLLAGQSYE